MCGCGGSPAAQPATRSGRERSGSAREAAPPVVGDPGGYVWHPPARTPAAATPAEPVPAQA